MIRLAGAEREHGVRIVLAVESGSRAWGFASPNSDYDVRFIYARPSEWYLAIDVEERPDVIEYAITDDIDLNGWDIRKALRLFWKSNPSFVEWIQSPLKYIERGAFAESARTLLPGIYSRESGIHHYRSMAKTNYRSYLRAAEVPLKKYFYVLRPLLAAQWIERYSAAPPIEFAKLLPLIKHEDALLRDIDRLLEKKRKMPEMGLSEPIGSITEFVEAELYRLETVTVVHRPKTAKGADLNYLFRATLREWT